MSLCIEKSLHPFTPASSTHRRPSSDHPTCESRAIRFSGMIHEEKKARYSQGCEYTSEYNTVGGSTQNAMNAQTQDWVENTATTVTTERNARDVLRPIDMVRIYTKAWGVDHHRETITESVEIERRRLFRSRLSKERLNLKTPFGACERQARSGEGDGMVDRWDQSLLRLLEVPPKSTSGRIRFSFRPLTTNSANKEM